MQITIKKQWATRLAGVSGAMSMGAALVGCTAEAEPEIELVGDDEAELHAGTGSFQLGWSYTDAGVSFTARGSIDEFTRVGQVMGAELPAFQLWSLLHPEESLPDADRLKKLRAEVVLHLIDGDKKARTIKLRQDGFRGSESYDLTITTRAYTIPRNVDTIRFSLRVTDSGDAKASYTAGPEGLGEIAVFGGDGRNATLVLDTMGSAKRERVIEGSLRDDSTVQVAYTDWRAQALVDSGSIDRYVGKTRSSGRFGPIEMPIFGELEYEVSFGYAIDGAWQPALALTAAEASRVVPLPGRKSYEGKIALPKGATNLASFMHVRAFLKVDYSKYGEVMDRRYADGARILMRERWDNVGNAAGQNYERAIVP